MASRYHYPEERVDRVPTFEFNPEQTRASRVAMDAFLKKTGAQLWIQHERLGAPAMWMRRIRWRWQCDPPNFYE
jgi:hypothetical protein